jgi:hypothetical protein
MRQCLMSFKMVFGKGFASWTENTQAPRIKPIRLIYPLKGRNNEDLPVCDRLSIVVRKYRHKSIIERGQILWENTCLAQQQRESVIRIQFEPQEKMPFLPAGAEISISAWSKTRVMLQGAIFFDIQEERTDA